MIYINQKLSSACSDVKCLAGCFGRSLTCFQVCLYDILNISKVPGLLSISVNGRNLSIHQLLNKLRNNGSIHAIRILTASKHIKITHSVGIQSIQYLIHSSVLLIHTLCQGIRRKKLSFMSFLFGENRMISVNRRAGGINKFLHSVLSGGFHHVQGSADVDFFI